MSSAEDHRWWNDVPQPIDADGLKQAASESAKRRVARVSRHTAQGGAVSGERTLSRAHAAGFADAFDLDGAFGAPSRRGIEFDADGGRVIVLERGLPSDAEADWDDFDEGDADSPPRRTLTLVVDDEWADAAAASPVAVESAHGHGVSPRRDVAARRDSAARRGPAAGRGPAARRDAGAQYSARREATERGAQRQAAASRELEPWRARASLGERFAMRPDRMGLYSVLLGIFLVVLAAASGGHT